MSSATSLDERYLDFSGRAAGVFAAYPQLEPLRQLVFKDLLVRRRADGWWQHVKHWLRPLVKRHRTRPPDREVDVLIWVENEREVIVDALLPVYRELLARGVGASLVSFGGVPGLPAAQRFAFPARVLPPPWAPAAWAALCECETGLRDQALRRSFYHACAVLRGLYDEMHALLDAAAPQAVVCASTQGIGGAALTVAARRRDIRSLVLQHGMMQPVYTPLVADEMLTWGPTSDEILVSLGLPRERLRTVGSPRHDALGPSGNGRARAALRRALALPDRPIFVFFSNGNDLVRNGDGPAECARWLEAVAAERAGELSVVVRLHPNEDGALYERCRHLTITRDGVGLPTTLEGCDWIGSLCSTALYDGLLYGKRVWHFHPDDGPALADNWKRGLAHRVSSERRLRDMVQSVLAHGTESRVDEDLVARVFANHGRATQAVAEVVVLRVHGIDNNARVRCEL
jgi:hypothetical protein